MAEDPATSSSVLLLAIVAFVPAALYAFYILAAICITRARGTRLRQLSRSNYFGAKYARLILTRADLYIHSCQIGAFLAALMTGICADELARRAMWYLWPEISTAERSFLSSALVTVPIILLVAAVGLGLVQVSRALAFARPTRVLCYISVPVILTSRLASPIVMLVRATIGKILKEFGLSIPQERELAVSAEQFSEILEQSTKAGQIEQDEKEMIEHVFTFSDTIVREVMTPRKEIVCIEQGASLGEVINLFLRERLSRVLVTGTNLDDVKGVLIAKDLLRYLGKQPQEFDMAKTIRPAYFVPSSKKVDDLLGEFKREALHFAVVLDEHGGVDGVVTLEDLIEEIVGEIFDEYDSPLEEVDVFRTKSGELLIEGSALIDDLNAAYNLDIPAGDYDTVGGFVLNLLGHVPKIGECVEHDGMLYKVEGLEQNRITQLRVSRQKKTRPRAISKSHSSPAVPPEKSNQINEKAPQRLPKTATSN